jgi:hypothetical protein
LDAKALEFHKHFYEGEEQFTISIVWLDPWGKKGLRLEI